MMEATLVLATVRQQFRLTSSPGYTVTPWPTITLQPKEGIFLRVENREAKPRQSKTDAAKCVV